MHDPLTVIFDIRRPPLTKRELRGRPSRGKAEADPRFRSRQWGPLCIRPRRFRCAHCDDGKAPSGGTCPDCEGRGYRVVALYRRPYFSWAFWRFGGREWYWPSVVTVWHVDPEKGGDDDSCRREVRRRQLHAHKDGRGLANAVLWWRFKRMHLWHVQHWRVQLRPWQALRRWLFTRCDGCGERFPYGYSPVSLSWDGEGRHPGRFGGERGLYHGGPWHNGRDCSLVAGWRRQYQHLHRLSDFDRDFQARHRLEWMGWLPWWRVAILQESYEQAMIGARLHPRSEELSALYPDVVAWAPQPVAQQIG